MSDSPVLSAKEAEEQYPGPSEFVHLHNHTLFSMLDGVAQPEQYFEACVEREWPAFAITEHGVLNSVPDAYWSAKKLGVKYIVGCEIYYNDYEPMRRELESKGSKITQIRAEDEELAMRISRNRHLTVLCKNMTGYENLLKINMEAWEHGFYYRPRVWFDLLAKYSEGLIVLSGCMNGPVSHELRHGNNLSSGYVTGAIDYVKRFRDVFGDDYYIELQMPGIEGDIKVMQQLAIIAEKLKIKPIVSNDCWNPEISVLTEFGSKPLCGLKIGDKVWTHKNRLKEVLCIGKRKVRKNERLFGFLGLDHFVCTGNHKLFARSGKGKPKFSKVEDLSNDDFVCIPKIKLPDKDLKKIRISDYVKHRLTKVKNGKIYPRGNAKHPLPDEYVLTDEILRIIGFYIAEGFVDSYRLGFAFHNNETDYIDEVMNFFSDLGLSPKGEKVSDNGFSIRICCSSWSYFLKEICGHRCYKKRLPPFWTKLSNRQLKVLIKAYIDGDGCFKRRVTYTTSPTLAMDLCYAMASIDLIMTIKKRKPKDNVKIYKKNGDVVNSKLSAGYYGYFPKPSFASLGFDIGEYDYSKVRVKNFCDEIGFWVLNPFEEINSNLREVWCIQVEDDNSFLTVVASSNCHYLERRDFKLQKVMMAIDQGTVIYDKNLFHVNSDEQYLKTRHELRASFHRNGYADKVSHSLFEQACSNTLEIADKCVPFTPDEEPKLPKVPDARRELVRLCFKALKERGLDKDSTRYLIDGREVTAREQMEIELKRLCDKKFESYFLITRDLVRCSLDHGWPLGPSRGSAGGSLVCYLLDIISINPLRFKGMSFNRFLSPARGGDMLKVTME